MVQTGMNRDPRSLFGADIRKPILGEAAADIASWTTPVPGRVGPATVAMLMRNAAIAFEKKIELGWV